MRYPFNFRKYALGLCLTLAALFCAIPAEAQIDPLKTLHADFSAVGVARGQVARLSAYYHDLLPPGPCAPETVCTPPTAFRATFSFTDCNGIITVRKSFTITPDRGASIIFAPMSFGADGRSCARGTISVEADGGYLPRLVPSVEVMDAATGQTSIINPGSLVGFNPQPEPPGDFNFGLFNVVQGETARVNVAYPDSPNGLPPGPCRVVITYFDGDGRTIGEDTQSIYPGMTAQSDYSTREFPAGWRGRIRASVHVESADGRSTPVIAPSLEVFSSDTGRSTLFYPGAKISAR